MTLSTILTRDIEITKRMSNGHRLTDVANSLNISESYTATRYVLVMKMIAQYSEEGKSKLPKYGERAINCLRRDAQFWLTEIALLEHRSKLILTEPEPITKLNFFVHQLKLNKRVIDSLLMASIRYIGDLVQKTEEEVLNLSGIGIYSTAKIKTKLQEIGLNLGMNVSDWNKPTTN